MNHLLLILSIWLFSCSNESETTTSKLAINETEPCGSLTLEPLKSMLNKELVSLPAFNCYTKNDTVLEGDEGVTWNGKAYYHKSKLAFIAEASWEATKTVQRVTVFSDAIKEGELYVGQQVKDIKSVVSYKLPSSPDGYLFLEYKKDKRVAVQLDISKELEGSTLFYGVDKLSKVPDTLKVESIVISK